MGILLARRRHTVSLDRQAVARDWHARGFSCGMFVDPPGREWLDFMHETNELASVVEGNLQLIVEGEAARLLPGDEAFIPRQLRHSVPNSGHGEARWLYGHDDPA